MTDCTGHPKASTYQPGTRPTAKCSECGRRHPVAIVLHFQTAHKAKE